MSKQRITAIIPTLSNVSGLKRVVAYLIENKIPTVVIDNHPTAAKKKICHHHLITYLPQAQNQGFASAVNIGFKQVKTPWALVLNDDIEFSQKKQLSVLIKKAQAKNWAAISPVLIKPNGKTENYGYQVLPIGRVKLNFKKSNSNLDGITAACLVISSEVFQKLGGFDENFFAYLEDVDLFLKMKQFGYEFGIDYETSVVHNHQATSKKMGNFKQKMDLINWWRLYFKHRQQRYIVFSVSFILERLRNLSGYLKATLKQYVAKN